MKLFRIYWMKEKQMKYKESNTKIYNYISAGCFFLSSISLLFIPQINVEDGFSISAYRLAGLFWIGLIIGTALQIFLWFRTKKQKSKRVFKKTKLGIKIVFVVSAISIVFISFFLKTHIYALLISMFLMLLSIEGFFVIKRMEKIS